MNIRPALFLLLIGLNACATPATPPAPAPAPAPPSIEGYWRGQFERDGSTLPVELAFSRIDGALSGSFSAPSLRAIGIPFLDVRLDGANTHFVLAGDRTTSVFDGAVTPETLSGTYAEGNAQGRFSFQRTQAPPSCRGVPAQWSNGAVMLSGSLILPERTPAPATVLFLHGSGGEGRFTSRFEATLLCRAGFAALIYDKRGVGQSTGDWREASFDDLAVDAAAGLDWLAARPEIDAAHIGIYGHSQGATIAPLVAAHSTRIAFIIAGAGGIGSTAEVERFSLRNSVDHDIHTDPERREAYAYVDRVVTAGSTGRGIAALIADAPHYSNRPWYFPPPAADSFYWRFQRRIASYDSAVYWRRVRVPVLLIYGENDERVPPASAAAISRTIGTHAPVETLMISGADHSYMMRAEGDVWPHLAPQFSESLISFVSRNARRATS